MVLFRRHSLTSRGAGDCAAPLAVPQPLPHATNVDPRAVLSLVLVALFWGSSFTYISIALAAFGPGELALVRFIVATATLGVVAIFAPIPRIERRDWPRLIVLSLLGITAYHLLLNFGQRNVPPGTSALIIQTAPVFSVLLASKLLGETVTRRSWFGIVTALTGSVVLVVGQGKGLGFTTSAFLIVLSAVATSLYFVLQQPLVQRYGARALTTWSMLVGMLPMLVFAPTAISQWQQASVEARLVVVYVGVFPAAVAYVLWHYLLNALGVSRATVFMYVTPIIAFVTAWLLLGTVPTTGAIVGGAITLLGVVVVNAERFGMRRAVKAAT
jgi:drug/metabolite transporter (DMT)-like permease